MHEIMKHIHKLSSKRAAERKRAIKNLRKHLTRDKGHLARLALHYVAHHDPSFCVRNLAKQAFYLEGSNPDNHIWERTYGF